ncbi:hypothetical protein ABFX02_08G112000 [Erythranthe guttata]
MQDDRDICYTLSLSQQLQIVEHEICSFLIATDLQICRYSKKNSSSSYYNTCNQQHNLLVGLDDQIRALKQWIFDPISHDLVKSVVGMTGIGKTTLVKKVYNDPRVVKEFETRLFLHIGPSYNLLEDILLLVLNQLGVNISDNVVDDKYDYLKKRLREALSSKKYLIVLDDVWSVFRHELKYDAFPNNTRESRVIIISQVQPVRYYNYETHDFLVPLLKDEESWKLLRQTAFSNSEEKCNRELEKIGKQIARNCEGLLLGAKYQHASSFEEWKTLSENEDPFVITRDDNTPLSMALYFSYLMLPQYLKASFLYIGVFPKHYGISRSKLIKLWLSEDLVIHEILKTRNSHWKHNQTSPKSCRLHFTFRSLCVNEAKSEKFFHILKKYTDCEPKNIQRQQRLCVHNNVVLAFTQVHEWMESVPNARSLLCYGPKQQYPVLLPLCLRLLKILDALAIRFYEFPHQVLALIHLRYFAITCDGELPNSISRLWNLEVLILGQHHNIKLWNNGPVYLPIEIWNMHKLKELYCKGFDLPTPPLGDSYLQNLFTISGVSVHSCTMEVLSRIPKLKRIAVQIESAHESIETFSFFGHFATRYDEFESLKCVVVNPNLSSHVVRCVPKFPVNITKISLHGCGLPWKNMGVIAALPYLKVLKLRCYAFCGPHWIVNSGEFPRLRILLLEDLDIEHWESNNKGLQRSGLHPEHLIVKHCYKLKNIPGRFLAGIVEVDDCSISLVEKMREWRSIDVKIHSSTTDL